MHSLSSLGRRDPGFESHSVHGCLVFVCVCVCVCVCVFLCSCTGRGLATSWSPVRGILPTVPDQETEETQPYAPKAGVSSQVWEQRERKKNALNIRSLQQFFFFVITIFSCPHDALILRNLFIILNIPFTVGQLLILVCQWFVVNQNI
jgi:hypothetical protein